MSRPVHSTATSMHHFKCKSSDQTKTFCVHRNDGGKYSDRMMFEHNEAPFLDESYKFVIVKFKYSE